MLAGFFIEVVGAARCRDQLISTSTSVVVRTLPLLLEAFCISSAPGLQREMPGVFQRMRRASRTGSCSAALTMIRIRRIGMPHLRNAGNELASMRLIQTLLQRGYGCDNLVHVGYRTKDHAGHGFIVLL